MGAGDSEAAAEAGLTTLAESLREQGSRCARIALGRPAGEPSWRVVARASSHP